jgi:hypothetical protein
VPLDQESMFYQFMWQLWARQDPYPIPWWVKQGLRRWIDNYDAGLFDSPEAALSSNALYRYWKRRGTMGVRPLRPDQPGGTAFGARIYSPYVVEGARWIRDNRSPRPLRPLQHRTVRRCSTPAAATDATSMGFTFATT